MSKIRTHYDNLKVARNAPDVVIKAAHKALLQLHHPDKSVDKEKAERITRILNDARDVLLDPVKRKQHDHWIKEQEALEKPTHHHHHKTHERAKPAPEEQEPEQTERRIDKYMAYSNGIALDTETRLQWCRCVLGQHWRKERAQGEPKVFTWHEALAAVKTLNAQGGFAGYQDWRLPTIQELKSLITKPKIAGGQHLATEVFPDSPSWLWSASPYVGYGGGAWYINFDDGSALSESENFHRAVRLVRG